MSADDRFEQRLPARLEELATPRTPSYFDDVISSTARSRQRPGWSFPERWIPMSTMTDRLATAPRAPLRLIVLASLIVLAAVAVAIIAGGSSPRVPAPFGTADNGRIAWVAQDGAIVAADGAGADPVTLVAGPGNSQPQFSPDGRRLLYLHDAPMGTEIVVADADGGHPATVASGGVVSGAMWAPDSRSIIVAANGTLARLEASAGATPERLVAGVDGTYDWNAVPSMLFQPPAGDRIAYVRDTGDGKGVFVAASDGSAPVAIVTPAGSGLAYADVYGLQWSPDGTRLAMTVALSATDGRDTRVYVVDADGSNLHRLTHVEVPNRIVSESNPSWSPDGRSIAMQVWHADPNSDSQDVRPITVVDVASGDEREVGSRSVNGFSGWGWAPDGASIIAVPSDGRISVIDVATGAPHSEQWQAASGATWQRVAP
jgi:Tol biopolymer transport system component